MKRKLFPFIIAVLLVVLLVAFVAGKRGDTDFDQAKELVIMRSIGHQILLYTGDSSSRVLPVEKLNKREFRISFQSAFTFKPDSIVQIIDEVVKKNGLESNYIVNVLECNSSKLIYGYAMFKDKQDDVIPCRGREQEKMRYCIDIKFQDNRRSNATIIVAASLLLLIGGIVALRKPARGSNSVQVVESTQAPLVTDAIPIGKYFYHPGEQSLSYEDEKIVLTNKEAKLLGIFAASPGITIDRNVLQKIWEDEGVIVSRSLDVFISRLRKKLEKDPSIKITNVHSKGYKLELTV